MRRPAAKGEFRFTSTEDEEENKIWTRVDERLPGLGAREEFNENGRRVARAKHTAQRESIKPFVKRLCSAQNDEEDQDEETGEGFGEKCARAFCEEVFRAAGDPRRMKFKIDDLVFPLYFE